MLDTRVYIKKLLDETYHISLKFVFSAFFISFIISFAIAFLPTYSLSQDGVYTLFILLFAALLWISEAIPAFAVALLVIGLEIILLGFHDFDFEGGAKEWQIYLAPWSNPLVFLFLAGFIMAEAASKTKLDLWLAKRVLFFVGEKPENILSGLIAITFTLSMFVSNTATVAMMMTILAPILLTIKEDNPFKKALLLSIMVGANIGGMATIIGTPPNAIAVGMLGDNAPSFIGWMILALPPAIIITLILRFIILRLYPSNEPFINLDSLKEVEHFDDSTKIFSKVPTIPSWKKQIVILIFSITILLWLTGPLHHIPTTVVSLLPIVAFTLFGIIDAEDIRKLRWDVIILIIGGLSLGFAVSKTGLDVWFASLISTDGHSVLWITLIFSYLIITISNFMSHTVATNIMLPIVVAIVTTLSTENTQSAVVAVALSASLAMALPISTPPNAIIYANGKLHTKDFLKIGLIVGIFAPLILIAWLYFI